MNLNAENIVTLIVALIGLAGVILSAVFSYRASENVAKVKEKLHVYNNEFQEKLEFLKSEMEINAHIFNLNFARKVEVLLEFHSKFGEIVYLIESYIVPLTGSSQTGTNKTLDEVENKFHELRKFSLENGILIPEKLQEMLGHLLGSINLIRNNDNWKRNAEELKDNVFNLLGDVKKVVDEEFNPRNKINK